MKILTDYGYTMPLTMKDSCQLIWLDPSLRVREHLISITAIQRNHIPLSQFDADADK